MRKFAVIAFLLSLSTVSQAAYLYVCPKVTTPPRIDGRLDDAAWKNTPVVKLVRSETGDPTAQATYVRMCWDDQNLYVSFDCEDQDIWGTMLHRDDKIYTEECAEIFLDPMRTLKDYYEINVSPRNVVFDCYKHLGAKSDTEVSWNCAGLQTAVVVDGTLDNRSDIDRKWTVEEAIPFSALGRPSPRSGERWRGNVYRINRTPAPEEYQAWSPTLVSPAAFHIPSHFGTIVFSDYRR